MKIALLNDSNQGIGGGWSFMNNLKKGLLYLGHEVTDNYKNADISVISGSSMVTKDTVWKVRESKSKLILRVDNVPRNSRNRNTGTSRLKEFAILADEIVWQCQWAKDYLSDFIGREGTIIYNGVDTDVFRMDGKKILLGNRENNYLYSRYNRDETKNWEVAWYKFQMISRKNKDAILAIVGNFSSEQFEYGFDFFRGEKISYLGVTDNPEFMAEIYRGCKYLMATYWNDCFSNTYLEGLACGMELYQPDMSGGTPEMLDLFNKNGISYFSLEKMSKNYEKLFKEVLQR